MPRAAAVRVFFARVLRRRPDVRVRAVSARALLFRVGALLWAFGAASAGAETRAELQSRYRDLPLRFEASERGARSFVARGDAYAMVVSPAAAEISLLRVIDAPRADAEELPRSVPDAQWTKLRMELVGADPKARARGMEPLRGRTHYLTGTQQQHWRTGVTGYARVEFREIYRAIDLVYYGNQGRLEYDFIVRPGADASAIKLGFAGADALEMTAEGDLLVRARGGTIRWTQPVAYQDVDGVRRAVEAAYVRLGEREIAFALGPHDPSRPLVLDPVLSYATYLGGGGSENVRAIALGADGAAYVVGYTFPVDYPTTAGAFDPEPSTVSGSDAFVTKLTPDGSELIYSTYLGGSRYEVASGVAVDASGAVYVTGYTGSTDFPTTAGVVDRVLSGDAERGDAFVAKLDPAGSALVYSTYLGGAGMDQAAAIAVDAAGNAYLTGATDSADFPTSAGALARSLRSASGGDAFVAKLDRSAGVLSYSTYLGGRAVDAASAIAVDDAGNAYVAGTTASPDFPTSPGAFDASFDPAVDSMDAFVTKLAPSGAALVYSTFLGGDGADAAAGIAVDASGAAYVTGSTLSANFPVTAQVLDPSFNADAQSRDAFVTKLAAAGTPLVYSTYLGGSRSDAGVAIAVDAAGNAYVAGRTTSNDFPVAGGDATLGGPSDVFVSELGPQGKSLEYSGYLGGSGNELSAGLAVLPGGEIFAAGNTSSPDLTVTPEAFDPSFNGPPGGFDGFVVRFATRPSVVPTQFVAKQFTEAYGRLPTTSEWATEHRFFSAPGKCTAVGLKGRGRVFYLSKEFSALKYDDAQRVLAVYRGVLNRNPTQGELDDGRQLLARNTVSWSVFADRLFDGDEFAALVPRICNTEGRDPANYYYGTTPQPVLPVPAGDPGFRGGSGAALQELLNGAPPGATVLLAQGSLTVLSAPLVIPAGKTLATTGLPKVTHYAKMGRLTMAEPAFSQGVAMILLESGAVLKNVFIDGNLGNPSRMTVHGPFAVVLLGGTGTAIRSSKLAASRSNNNIGVASSNGGFPCSGTEVSGNLLTGYGGQHHPAPSGAHFEQLGVEAGCGSTVVDGNAFVDLTDNALAAYSVFDGVQASKFTNNFILQAGNSAYSGISLDSIVGDSEPRIHSWVGFLARGNRMGGNDRVHTDTLISVGTGEFYERAFFRAQGSGAKIQNNEALSEPTLQNRVNVAVATQGMLDAIEINTFGELEVVPTAIACGSGTYVAAVTAGRASGTLEGPYEDRLLNNCMWHSSMP